MASKVRICTFIGYIALALTTCRTIKFTNIEVHYILMQFVSKPPTYGERLEMFPFHLSVQTTTCRGATACACAIPGSSQPAPPDVWVLQGHCSPELGRATTTTVTATKHHCIYGHRRPVRLSFGDRHQSRLYCSSNG